MTDFDLRPVLDLMNRRKFWTQNMEDANGSLLGTFNGSCPSPSLDPLYIFRFQLKPSVEYNTKVLQMRVRVGRIRCSDNPTPKKIILSEIEALQSNCLRLKLKARWSEERGKRELKG
ncbi:hypothetical protein Adt_05979 [Abeliophyllum distichum]|uniref:Uncharacterized protein n=1 Tax=Abeliophyllum distichum TaxID=126358 RepID=A0ABD1V6V0_9LAMI